MGNEFHVVVIFFFSKEKNFIPAKIYLYLQKLTLKNR